MAAAERFPVGFGAAIRRFNAGEFFEAHEAFEELLDQVEGDHRWELLVALIQIAVGYHKGSAGYPGAGRMLALGAAKLAPFPAVAWGVAVEQLRRRAAEDLAALEAGGCLATRLKEQPPRIEMVPRRPG